jgi:MoaA/NifB/PqqE/SkfB family radical SAM enzyme
MKIHNVRMGLATNSSSTHSLILMTPTDYKATATDEYGDFGWSYFTAADKTSKENYLGYILHDNLRRTVGDETAWAVVAGMFSHREDFASQLEKGGYGVDHQSVFTLPKDWEGKGIDIAFFKALREYIVQNPIAILGGNDNGEGPEGHPLHHKGKAVDLGIADGYGTMVARNDGDHWVIFHRDNGSKIRLSFDGKTQTVTKAKTPELVDIKITDFCPFGCEYCYQASTTEGQHGNYGDIRNLIYALKDMKVFEVAIGGGEPTLHPDFIRILEDFRAYHIVPNFTTRNLAWLNDEEKAKKIMDACGAFAYSVNTREDVAKLAAVLDKYKGAVEGTQVSYGSFENKVSVQYVLECGGDLAGVLDEAAKHHFRVTLLGFKTTGFGKDFPTAPEDWMKVVKTMKKEHGWKLNLGVDTAIVQKYGDRIKKELGVKDEMMTAEEGKFSMYIDAVAKTMAPSSYCEADEYVPLPAPLYGAKAVSEGIEHAFSKW